MIIYAYNFYEKSVYLKLSNQEKSNTAIIDSLWGTGDSFIPDTATKSKNDPLGILDKKRHSKWTPPADAEEVKPKIDLSVLDSNNLPSPSEVLGDNALDSVNKNIILKLRLENKKIEQELSEHQSINSGESIELAALLILLFLYPVRFLFLIIRWAFKTVREPINP